jgi:hypothetical protein
MLALSLPALLAAQDFRLEDYAPSPYHRHFLSLAPELSWGFSGTGQDRDSIRTEAGSGFGGSSLGLAYGSRAWSPSREWNLAGNLGLSANGNGYRSRADYEAVFSAPGADGSRSSAVSGRSQADAFATYRTYLRGSWFAEPFGRGSVSYSPSDRSRNRSWQRNLIPVPDSALFEFRESRSRHTAREGNASAGFAIGFGRILDVGFASTGMFMLDRLADPGAPAARLDAQGMRDLEAYLESRRKLRPFLDRRRAAIFDMATVERFLAERGFGPIPAQALLAMADEWANPSPIPRRSGWALRFYPYLRGSWRENRGWDERKEWSGIRPADEDEDISIAAVTRGPETRLDRSRDRSFQGGQEYGMAADWEYQRPWRRRFQFGVRAECLYSDAFSDYGTWSRDVPGIGPESVDSDYARQHTRALAGDASVSAAWIPQSRTSVQASLTAHTAWKGNRAPHPDWFSDDGSEQDASVRVALAGGHEFAPRLALQGILSWDGSWNDGYRLEHGYYPVQGYRYRHETNLYGSWRSDLRLKYYLF